MCWRICSRTDATCVRFSWEWLLSDNDGIHGPIVGNETVVGVFSIVKSSVLRGYIFDNIRVDLTRTDCWNWRMKFIGAKCFNPNGELKQLSLLVCLDVENVFFCFNESLVLTLSSHFINLSCMFLMFIVRYIINNWTKPMTRYTYIYMHPNLLLILYIFILVNLNTCITRA